MKLDIGGVVEDAARRTLKRNGLMLVAAFFLLNLAGAFLGVRQGTGAGIMGGVNMFGGNPLALGLLGLLVSIVSIAVSIVALRVFVSGETEVVPDEAMRRNMGNALLHTVVGGVVFGVLVAVGLILLVIPGIYLILALFFWTVYVAVEDQNFYEAMQSSWEITKGYKWSLLALLIAVGIVNVLLTAVGAFVSFAGPRLLGLIVLQVFSAFGGVFALAAQARAFERIRG